MRFLEMYGGWQEGRLSQEEAAMVLGVCPRTFRRQICRYEEKGLEGLNDKRLTQASQRRAPVDEVIRVTGQYRSRYRGWNVKHFYSWYVRDGGKRSYTWVKNTLQKHGDVQKLKKKGTHRRRRERSPLPGMMIHQDGSSHEWVLGKKWDLIVTMDDATNEHYNAFFVPEEGTGSSFQGVQDVILRKGLFSTIYTDRGSHYWYTPKERGKLSKTELTQFGRAMQQLGIVMIPAYSPRPEDEVKECSAPIRTGWSRNLPCTTLPAWRKPIIISKRPICRHTTGSLNKNPRRRGPRLFPGQEPI
ncbi:MAG: helix-turn-helix domain-containing protein [Smithella sp.]|nr:helix-turn-helix domain-containing protein [Smithella sp.]